MAAKKKKRAVRRKTAKREPKKKPKKRIKRTVKPVRKKPVRKKKTRVKKPIRRIKRPSKKKVVKKKAVKKSVKRRTVKRRKPVKRKSRKQLEKEIQSLRNELRLRKLTKNFVHALSPEWLHRDGTVALQPSRVRHLNEKSYRKLLKTLSEALEGDTPGNDLEILADMYEVSVRELYTLFFSP